MSAPVCVGVWRGAGNAPCARPPSARECRRTIRAFASALITLSVAACTPAELSRNVYEGGSAYQESLRGTPLETSRPPAPPFDEYDRERRAPGSEDRGQRAEDRRPAAPVPASSAGNRAQ